MSSPERLVDLVAGDGRPGPAHIAVLAMIVSGFLAWCWTRFRAEEERRRLALESRLAEWRVRDITWSAMRQMLDAAREGVGERRR